MDVFINFSIWSRLPEALHIVLPDTKLVGAGGGGWGLDLVPTEILRLTLNVFTSYKKHGWNLLTLRILFRRLVSNSFHILI